MISNDILVVIATHLSVTDICNLLCVSKDIRTVIDSDICWGYISQRYKQCTSYSKHGLIAEFDRRYKVREDIFSKRKVLNLPFLLVSERAMNLMYDMNLYTTKFSYDYHILYKLVVDVTYIGQCYRFSDTKLSSVPCIFPTIDNALIDKVVYDLNLTNKSPRAVMNILTRYPETYYIDVNKKIQLNLSTDLIEEVMETLSFDDKWFISHDPIVTKALFKQLNIAYTLPHPHYGFSLHNHSVIRKILVDMYPTLYT